MTNEMPTTTVLKPKRAPRGTQPQKQANKNKMVVNRRRKIIVQEILKGTPHKEAGIIAGFSPATAASQVSQTLKNPKVQNSLIAEMERLEMNDDYFAKHHKALIEGMKVISANIIVHSSSDLKNAGSITKDFIEVPDFVAKAKGLEMAYKLTGRFVDRHELDIKQPVNITIKKFCSRGQKDAAGNNDSPVALR